MSQKNTKKWRRSQYVTKERSIGDMAKDAGVSKSTLRRQLIKDGITLRNKSEAQSVALKRGRSTHPTEGKQRPENVRIQISEGVSKTLQGLSDEERERRSEMARQQWEAMSQNEKDDLLKAARDAARETAKTGSKLEKFLYQGLTKAGFRVQYHIEGLIPRTELQLDMYLPELGIAIEVDGPSHFYPIWGEENLRRNQRSDAHKNGLLIERGFIVIRVKQLQKSVSNKLQRDMLTAVLSAVEKVKKKKPGKTKRLIEIEVN